MYPLLLLIDHFSLQSDYFSPILFVKPREFLTTNPHALSPFRAVKATLDGVTSAPFATYHILTCIGLIATNHLLADHREHPRRIRLEERGKRDGK